MEARGNETVVVVDDSPAVRTLVVRVLEGQGYRVFEAPDAATALDLASEVSEFIHLLLTDVAMPGMTGQELAERFARIHTETKVLFMSGYPGDATVAQGVSQFEGAYLQKPFSPRVLADKVRALLDEPSRS